MGRTKRVEIRQHFE